MQTEKQVIPQHIGFIVDGNRRWAKKHGLPTYEGHLAGYSALKDIVLAAVDKGVKYVSLYVFSTENWRRSKDEVAHLMKMTLNAFTKDLDELVHNQIRVRVLGSREGVDPKILEAISKVEQKTNSLTRGTIGVCFNYGGQREIVDAVRLCLADGLTGEQITEDSIRSRLYEPEMPDVDIMVRTSGEQRLSNFMLWRCAYSEFLFLDKLWPDMRPDDIDEIINEYQRRERRFGGTK